MPGHTGLIYQQRRVIAGEELLGTGASEFRRRRNIEGDICMVGEETPQQTGPTRLPCAGEHERRKTLRQGRNMGSKISLNPHI